jgi:hypothetical protein
MLIILGFGTAPSNFTTPFKLAVVLAVGGGPPAFTALGVETQIASIRAIMRIELFIFIVATPQF